MFEIFTDTANAVLPRALLEATGVQAKEIKPIHLLLGIVDAADGIAQKVLQGEGVNRETAARELGPGEASAQVPRHFPRGRMGGTIQYSSASVQAFKAAEQQAKQLQSPTISAEHLLLGLLETDEVEELVGALGAVADSIGNTVRDRLRESG